MTSFKLVGHADDEINWHGKTPQSTSCILLASTNMVRTSEHGELRMRKQNTNRAVPLDAMPERRAERCSPRFQPGDRFCELSFKYL